MKYIEQIPARYDKMMNILTFGGHRRSQKLILSGVARGSKVLDIGCGSGSLAVECARSGAEVTAVDSSPQMLSILKSKIKGGPLENKIRIIECGSASAGVILKDEKFDIIIMSMMLGELSPVVRKKTIQNAAALLAPEGSIIICDELWPRNIIMSAAYHFLFWIFFIPNFILTRTLIMPVKGLLEDLDSAGLKIEKKRNLFKGIISILNIKKL
jgi:ubiquinone/menaquinone biosynthesis C-methylase UbiE